jgi:ADP-ribose pyrophosphatase
MRANEIDRLEEVLAYSQPENHWVKLYFDRVKFPGGAEGRYNRIIESDGKKGVVILPLHNSSVGLVRQFRYPVGKFLWEIPRGFGDHDDTVVQALIELREEASIHARAEDLIDLGTMYPNSGILASEAQLFAIVADSATSHVNSTDSESTEFQWFPLPEVLALVNAGNIKDAFTMCALLRAAGRGLIRIA